MCTQFSPQLGFDEALVFLFHVDNTGPQDVLQAQLGWQATSRLYPNAILEASSMDAFTRNLLARTDLTSTLPIVTSELGDTWIYGCSSDPAKVRIMRLLARFREAAIASGTFVSSDERVENFSRNLVKLGEHTWGNNEGSLFTTDYSNAYFDLHYNDSSFQSPLASFIDQRAYLTTTVAALADHPLRSDIEELVKASAPAMPSWINYSVVSPPTSPIHCNSTLHVISVSMTNAGALLITIDGATTELVSVHYTTHSEQVGEIFSSRLLCGSINKINVLLFRFIN